MEPGPEGHPRVQRQDHVVRLPPVAPPGGPDDDAPADPEHRKVRLPGVGPVGLEDDGGGQVPDRPHAEGLEMAEIPVHPCDGLANRGDIEDRQVGADHRGPAEVDARDKALFDELEGGLHAGPAGRRPGEDLGHGLDGLVVRGDGELKPGARGGRGGVEVDAREGSGDRVAPGLHRSPRPFAHRPSFSRIPPPDETPSPASFA